jgi:hypothetical protein
MNEPMRKFVRFEDKLFWVDMQTFNVIVMNPDGSFRPIEPEDGSVFEVLIKGRVEEASPSVESVELFRASPRDY